MNLIEQLREAADGLEIENLLPITVTLLRDAAVEIERLQTAIRNYEQKEKV